MDHFTNTFPALTFLFFHSHIDMNKYRESKQYRLFIVIRLWQYVSGRCTQVTASILLRHPPDLIRSLDCKWRLQCSASPRVTCKAVAIAVKGDKFSPRCPPLMEKSGLRGHAWPCAPTCTHPHTHPAGGQRCLSLACECE